MGKRGKDKRTEETLRKFHDMVNQAIQKERLSYIVINDKQTHYIISSNGVVYNAKYGTDELRVIRPFIDKDGHIRISLSIDGMRYKKSVHKLVAEAFIPNIENKPYVHHMDGDTLNNRVDNLTWVTKEEHTFLTDELNQYAEGLRGACNPSSTHTDNQIERALQLMEENTKFPDEICSETGISYSVFQHLRYRQNSWGYLKDKYDISKYNKFRRLEYSIEQKNEFIDIRNDHPEYTLRKISEILGIKYETIKTWNSKYFGKTA